MFCNITGSFPAQHAGPISTVICCTEDSGKAAKCSLGKEGFHTNYWLCAIAVTTILFVSRIHTSFFLQTDTVYGMVGVVVTINTKRFCVRGL